MDLYPRNNRKFAELVYPGKDCTYHPDYAADPRLVLREMMKRKRWVDFLDVVGVGGNTEINSMIDVHYILDETGKLRDTAIEWMREVNNE